MIFAENAPAPWGAGLPVIPLNGKQPVVKDWSRFQDRMPTDEEQAAWLARYPRHNMGLVLGPQSGLLAVDVDGVDEAAADRVLDRLGAVSSWKRRGKRGYVVLFRYSGERSFKITAHDGKVLIELLSAGKQVVLPPSIHPDTRLPYTANAPLLDVLGDVRPLPSGITP